KIIIYTDGLVEVKSVSGTKYDQNDLKRFLLSNYPMKASELYLSIKENLFHKIGNEKILDDVTFLIMEVH
ncbi:MAG: SpoIIE family protein phosphatase, partial [Tissierellia bacterium]|nr:SpoIIE family protein phosphatase [Tissierellia bacterium]